MHDSAITECDEFPYSYEQLDDRALVLAVLIVQPRSAGSRAVSHSPRRPAAFSDRNRPQTPKNQTIPTRYDPYVPAR